MPIFKGTTKMKAAYKGISSLSAIYKGSYLVWLKKFLDTISGTTPLSLPKATADPIDEANLYGMAYQGVPSDYKRLEYLEFNKSGYVPTNVYLESTDTLKFKIVTTSATGGSIIGCFGGTNNTSNYCIYGMALSPGGYIRYNGSTYRAWQIAGSTEYVAEMSSTGLVVNGSTMASWSELSFTANRPMYIGHLYGSESAKFTGKFYEVEVVGRFKGVPCKRTSDNALGYYDTVTNTFFPAEGTLTAGPEVSPAPTTPVPIYCNNGELKANQQGQVYADGPQETISLTHNSTTIDTASPENLLAIDTYKDVQDLISGSVTRNVGILVLDGTESWTVSTNYSNVYQCNVGFTSVSTPKCTHFVGLNANRTIGNVSSTPDGIKFETSNNNRVFVNIDSIGTTEADLVSFLAQQYANGTPVIVVYPLSTPTTTTVASQELECQEGTNIVSSNKGAREMEITYWRN